ncbi:hypothetical protein V1512DRAFT_290672 [Lipomyces arxii]|uniref:uncharacterized protein n=1 Tax=Lipomyces arxii TaxID=56418 RepID=UPI0034CEFD41
MSEEHRSNWRRRPSQPNQPNQPNQTPPTPHVAVRGFNGREVEEYLNTGYVNAIESAKSNDSIVIYQNSKGWTSQKSNSSWGQKTHLTTKGTSVISELRKGLQSLQD